LLLLLPILVITFWRDLKQASTSLSTEH
jgi:hypothetical protein